MRTNTSTRICIEACTVAVATGINAGKSPKVNLLQHVYPVVSLPRIRLVRHIG